MVTCSAYTLSTWIVSATDIYLHADLQHRLFSLLKQSGKQVILATHSPEIINEADRDEVVLVSKERKSGKRITDISGFQEAIDSIGSAQNIHLARLSKGKKVLFLEGADFKLLKKFASHLKLHSLATDVSLTIIPIGGFPQWRKVEHAVWTFEEILQTEIQVGALFDRDYRCDEEVTEFLDNLKTVGPRCFVLGRKEIENYLLVPEAITLAVLDRLKINEPNLSQEGEKEVRRFMQKVFRRTTERCHDDVLGQVSAHRVRYFTGKTSKDISTVVRDSIASLEKTWADLTDRLAIVPGKDVLGAINREVQEELRVSVTAAGIVRHIQPNEMPDEFRKVLESVDALAGLSGG